MPELSALQVVGITAAAVLVIGWLVVSFQRPGLARSRVAWIAASAMYLAFVAFFVNLFQRAQEASSTAGMVAFGFLAAMFVGGLLVSTWKTVVAFRKGSAGGQHATH